MPNADESTNGDAAAGIAGAPSTITTSGGVGNDPVDNIIDHLLSVRGSRPGRQVDLSEAQIKMLCVRSREILINQPMLLELEAPIKICGGCSWSVL